METIEIFDRLKSLQVILGRKYELESKIEEAPKQLSSQDELLARMRKEFIEKNKEYEEIKEKVYSLRIELEETVKTREAGEKNMDNRLLQWHPAFYATIQIEFRDELNKLHFENEHHLSKKPMQIDVLIIKKRTFVHCEEYDSYEEYILFDRFDSCFSV